MARARALVAVQDQVTGAPHAGRYRTRDGPLTRRHRPALPDDVGADQARARAAGARRDARGALPPGEALENVPRSAREAGHDVAVDGDDGADRARMSERLVAARASFRETRRGRRARAASSPRRAGAGAPRRTPPLLDAGEIERYSRQLVLPEWSELAQLALRDASVLVVGAGRARLAGRALPRRRGRRAARHRRRRRRRALQPAPPAPALHARRRRAEGRARGGQAALPEPRHRGRALPGAPRRDQRRGAGRGPGPGRSTAATPSRPATPSTPPAATAGIDLVEGGVVGWSGLVMAIRPGATACYRCAFPTAPTGAPTCAQAGVLGPGRGRDRLAAGARGAQAADRRARAADRRVPAGRPRRPSSSRACRSAARPTARTAGTRDAEARWSQAARCDVAGRAASATPRREGVSTRDPRRLAGPARAARAPRRARAGRRRRAVRSRARSPTSRAR